MSSKLLLLDSAGALRKMFDVEKLDSDRGIIEKNGYESGLGTVLVYGKGAYSDSFGLSAAQLFFNKLDIPIVGISRDKTTRRAFLVLDLPNLPNSFNAEFTIPKGY